MPVWSVTWNQCTQLNHSNVVHVICLMQMCNLVPYKYNLNSEKVQCYFFWAFSSTALKTKMIVLRTLLHGLMNTSENHCCHCIYNCKAKAIYQQYPETEWTCWLLWARSHLRWTDTKWKKCAVIWWVYILNCFLKSWMECSLGFKWKRTIQFVTSTKFKSLNLWWCRGVLVPMAWVTCTSVKLPLMLNIFFKTSLLIPAR